MEKDNRCVMEEDLLQECRDGARPASNPHQTFLTAAAIYFSAFLLAGYYFYNQAVYPRYFRSDLARHLEFLDRMQTGDFFLPHFGFQMLVWGISLVFRVSEPIAAAALIVFCFMASVYIAHRIIRYFLEGRYSDNFLLLMAVSVFFLAGVFFPLLDPYHYRSMLTPNPWHNPTSLVARPFSLLLFFMYPLLLKSRRVSPLMLTAMATLLLVSTVIKPSFSLVFLPAAFIFTAIRYTTQKRAWIAFLAVSLPCVGLMAFQYLFFYGSGAESSIKIGFLKVWHLYTDCVPLAILKGLLFPLLYTIVNFRNVWKEDHLLTGWIMTAGSILAFALFYEDSFRMSHGNFAWSYMVSLGILFLFSGISFLSWVRQQSLQSLRSKVLVGGLSACYLMHVFSGGLYFYKIAFLKQHYYM